MFHCYLCSLLLQRLWCHSWATLDLSNLAHVLSHVFVYHVDSDLIYRYSTSITQFTPYMDIRLVSDDASVVHLPRFLHADDPRKSATEVGALHYWHRLDLHFLHFFLLYFKSQLKNIGLLTRLTVENSVQSDAGSGGE